MKRIINIAAIVLVVQIGLVAALQFGGSNSQSQPPTAPLFDFTPESVTALIISGAEKEQLLLEKKGTEWLLPEFFGAPANSRQVADILTKLSGLKQGMAVGTTAAASRRFKVADDLFQRHLVVKAGDKLVGDLYLGTSPGFRQIHARKAGTENVVAVELSTFELEPKADQWLDKNMFQMKEEDIESLAFADFTLEKKDKEWQLKDLQEGQATDGKAAADLVAKVSGLTIQTVIKPQEAEPLFAASPALQFSVSRKGGGVAQFRLVKTEGDTYILKHSERDLYCKVHNLQVEGLLKIGRDALLAQPQAPPVEGAEPQGAETPPPEESGPQVDEGK